MKESSFALQRWLIVSEVVKELASRYAMDEVDALRLFTRSKVYAMLENEETKFWHFSPMCLCMMYDEEKTTGDFSLPEEI